MKDTVAQSLSNMTKQLKGELTSLTGQIELQNNIATITQVRVTFRLDQHIVVYSLHAHLFRLKYLIYSPT